MDFVEAAIEMTVSCLSLLMWIGESEGRLAEEDL